MEVLDENKVFCCEQFFFSRNFIVAKKNQKYCLKENFSFQVK
jgi:hypothetical protein